MAVEFVAIWYPETGGVAKVPEHTVEHWESLGWRRVPDGVDLDDDEQRARLLEEPKRPTLPEKPPATSEPEPAGKTEED